MTIGDSLGPGGKQSSLQGVNGWLAFLCVSLLIFTPIGVVAELISGLDKLQSSAETIFGVTVDAVLAAFAIFVGLALVRIRRYAVRSAKIFFFVTLALGLLASLSFFVDDAPAQGWLIGIRTTITSTAWILYLYRSERVRVTYAEAEAAKVSDVFT